MNTEAYIAKKILQEDKSEKKISTPIVRISIIGIAVGIAVMIATIAIVKGFQNEIRDKVMGMGAHIQITNYDNNTSEEPAPINKNQDFIPTFKKNNQYQHIQAYAFKNGLIKTQTDNEGVLLKGVDGNYNWTFLQKNLKDGRLPQFNDSAVSKDVLISTQLVKRLGLKLNNKLLIYFVTTKKDSVDNTTSFEQRIKEFNICGIYETGFDEYDKKLVIVDIKQIQKLNYWDNSQIGGFEVLVNNYNKLDIATDTLNEMIGSGLIAQSVKKTNESIFSWLDLQDINAIIVITLMTLVAAINMISALLILILERTHMIGILKALGASNSSIQEIFIYTAMRLVSKGLLWGNIIGISLCLIQKYLQPIKLSQETYYVSVVPIDLNILNILILNGITFLVCFIMLLIPSFIIAKINPIKAIRFS